MHLFSCIFLLVKLLRLARYPLLLLCLTAATLLVVTLPRPWAGSAAVSSDGILDLPGIHIGTVEALLLLLIGGISVVVVSYSVRNLQGQPGLTRYAGMLLVAVGALVLVVTTDSLVVLAAAWTVSSQALARLVGHAGTAEARRASRLVGARLAVGDLLLWGAVLVTGVWLGAWDRRSLPDAVAAAPSAGVALAALLVVAAGVVRSALVPAHRWLPETAEAPSPVSALLHAGFVNGVGVLALLMWPIISAAWPARAALVVVGVTSAVVGAAQVRARGDLKGRLAASTSSQMGYLAIQAGLGIPAAVVAHIVGHGVWKARKFLGAGGAIQRSRLGQRSASRGTSYGEVAASSVAAVGVVVGAAAVPLGWLPTFTAPAEMLAIAITVAVVTLAFVTVRRSAVPSAARSAALGVTTLAAVAYVIGLRGLTAITSPVFGAPAPWGSSEGAVSLAIVVALVAVGLVWGQVDAAARGGRLPSLTRRAALGSLRPRPVRLLHAPRPVARIKPVTPAPDDTAAARAHIEVASATTATLYPLTTFVASNPLSGVETLGFVQAHALIAELGGSVVGPTGEMLRASIERGAVSRADIDEVIEARIAVAGPLRIPALQERSLHDVVTALLVDDEPQPSRIVTASRSLVRADVTGMRAVRTPMEVLGDHDLDRRVREVGHHVCTRSLAAPTWRGASDPWIELRDHGRNLDVVLGVRGVADAVSALPQDPAEAAAVLLNHLGIDPPDRPLLLGRLLARDPGWPAHLTWRNRHALLGREAGLAESESPDHLPSLIATRLALEVVVAEAHAPRRLGRALVLADLVTTTHAPLARLLASNAFAEVDLSRLDTDELRSLALILGPLTEGGLAALRSEVLDSARRRELLDQLGQCPPTSPAHAISTVGPRAQVVACIDVRSERLRRHLEHRGPWETFGAAGFFGLPIRHVGTDGQVSERSPALLRPSAAVSETAHAATGVQGLSTALSSAMATIEATPSVVLGWAEAAGWVLAPFLVLATVRPSMLHRWSTRGRDRLALPQSGVLDVGAAVGVDRLVDASAAFLESTGLIACAGLVVLVGHGATVTNNPHVAAYDCGACGGAAGDVSARVMVGALNDERVRAGLAERGSEIHESTRFVAALHDTTTDEVHVLDRADVPAGHRDLLHQLETDLRSACGDVLVERLAQLPDGPASSTRDTVLNRAADWAQPRPEWGLAGASAIVVGPRSLTCDADLGGRVFLQSYRPDRDPDSTVLAGLLSAPVVVAHWITAQYRASTLDPHRFGAGDKTTHNVVGQGTELSAVVTGARGDLRLGLPWQAVSTVAPSHDSSHGQPWRTAPHHAPHRLLVVVAADIATTEAALALSPEATALVTGDWITLCALDPSIGAIARRRSDGAWIAERGVEAQARSYEN